MPFVASFTIGYVPNIDPAYIEEAAPFLEKWQDALAARGQWGDHVQQLTGEVNQAEQKHEAACAHEQQVNSAMSGTLEAQATLKATNAAAAAAEESAEADAILAAFGPFVLVPTDVVDVATSGASAEGAPAAPATAPDKSGSVAAIMAATAPFRAAQASRVSAEDVAAENVGSMEVAREAAELAVRQTAVQVKVAKQALDELKELDKPTQAVIQTALETQSQYIKAHIPAGYKWGDFGWPAPPAPAAPAPAAGLV